MSGDDGGIVEREGHMLSPKSIANYLLDLARADGQTIDPMKLQKLVYYAHGWYAGYRNAPLIDEQVEAWPYGPVIPSLYYEFKRFGAGPILAKATEFCDGGIREVPPPQDPQLQMFLQNVWKSYGRFTSVALSEMTHAQGSPWEITRRSSNGMRSVDIQFVLIKNHFDAAVAEANRTTAVA